MFDCFDFYKDVGQICNEIPFHVTYANNWPFFAVALEKSFHIYGAEELGLSSTGPVHKERITHIASDAYRVFTCTDKHLRSTERESNEFIEIELDSPVSCLKCFDPFIVIAQDHKFSGYKTKTLELVFSIECPFNITYIIHPLGYVNKFIVSLTDGSYQIWNINSQALVFSNQGFDSTITQIVQSTVQDIFAFACADGKLVLHNVRTDETIFTLQHSSPISALSFRLDGPPHLCVGLMSGDFIVWDLSTRNILATLPKCHSSQITSVTCLKNVNLVVTAGADNAIRQWVFDPDSKDVLRLHRSRVGHTEPPKCITFANVSGNVKLITASSNASIIAADPHIETSAQLLSLSPINPKHLNSKINSISSTNAHRFASIASQHENGSLVFLWDVENSRFAKVALTAMPKNGIKIETNQTISFNDVNAERTATCTFLTKCGNYCIVGTSSGSVEVFVNQSGRRKGSISHPHESKLVFVHVDALNNTLVSGSEDGSILFHGFNTLECFAEIHIESPLKNYAPHPNSQIIAISHGQDCITLLDCVTRNVAREFKAPASTMAFSHNGKFLFVGSIIPQVYLFDIITSTLIETAIVDSPVVGFAVHPNGDFVATIHSEKLATKLWYFIPSRITKVFDSAESISMEHVGLAQYSELPLQKVRNIVKPQKDPLKYPKQKMQIPFFLVAPSISSNPFADIPKTEDSMISFSRPITSFVSSMLEDSKVNDFSLSTKAIINMPPEDIHIEISSLGISNDIDERLLFIQLLKWAVSNRAYFEIIQSVLNIFLNEHALKLSEDSELRESLKELLGIQKSAMKFFEEDLPHSISLIQMINKIQ